MKKTLVLVFAAALLFAVTAFAEPVKFPNGLTIDVAPGWSYEGEGEGITLIAEDESCVIFISVSDAEGASSKDVAEAMSREHGGSKPQQIDEDIYLYTFNNEHGADCRVFTGVDNGKIKIVLIAGDHKDVEDMINSIEELFN